MLFPHNTNPQESNDKKMLDEFAFTSHFIGILLIFVGAGLARPALMNLSVEHFSAANKNRLLAWQNVSGIFAGLVATIIAPLLRDKKVCLVTDEFIHVNAIMFSVVMITTIIFHIIGSVALYKANKGRKQDAEDLVNSVKSFKSILLRQSHNISNTGLILFFLPLIIIWALLEQQFTYFVLQALKSDRLIFSYKIHPIHVMVLHPIFLIVALLFKKHIFYRFLEPRNYYSKPLKRVVIGCFVAIGAYISAYYFDYLLNNNSNEITPKRDEAHFRIFNAMKCDYVIETFIRDREEFHLKHMEMLLHVQPNLEKDSEDFYCSIKLDEEEWEGDPEICPSMKGNELQLRRGKAMGYVIEYVSNSKIGLLCYEDDVSRSKDMRSKVR